MSRSSLRHLLDGSSTLVKEGKSHSAFCSLALSDFGRMKVHGTRFTDKYLQARQMYNRGSYGPYGTYGMPLPPRKSFR
jgi:hypothetical protein